MNTEQLDAIQERADAATEGPWETVRHDLSLYVQSKHANLQANLGYVGNRPEPDANFIANARTDVPALLALVRSQQAQIERVEALASSWESRGEYDMAYSKTMADEEAATQILANGAQLVDDARLIRNAINNEGTIMPEQPETLLEDTDPETVFTISLSVADAVDAIEDHLRNDDLTDLNSTAVNIWGILIDASSASLTATEGAA